MGVGECLKISHILAIFPFVVHFLFYVSELGFQVFSPISCKVSGTGCGAKGTSAVSDSTVPVGAIESSVQGHLEYLMAKMLAQMVIPGVIPFLITSVLKVRCISQ
jgi:hypothetical protein